MDNDRDIVGLLADVIREETMFLRHYIGQVFNNVDPLRKGRVLAMIPELGFDTPDAGMWCFPRQSSSMIVPEVLDYVEVYFMAGDPDRPVYMYPASEMADMVPAGYDGLPTTKIIFQDKKTGDMIKYNTLTQQLDIISALFIKMNNGTEPFVKGNALITYLTALVTNINANYTLIQTAIVALGGAYVPVPASNPAGTEISTGIFGK